MRVQVSLAGFVLLAVGCGSAAGPADERAASVINPVAGEIDEVGKFSAVGGLLAYKGELAARCTATLIAPNLVLTARHCVAYDDGQLVTCGQQSLGESVVASDVFVTGLPVMSRSMEDYAVAEEIIFAPGGDDTCGFDLAAVRLSAAPPGAMRVFAPRLDEPVVAGETFIAVGYGSSLASDEVGTRRYFEPAEVVCAGQDCSLPEVQPNEWLAQDDAFCSADSGGAALDGQGRLVGVVSRGQNPCSTPILAAMPAWQDWLIDVARAAAAVDGSPPAPWAMPVSAPDNPEVPGERPEKTQPSLKSTCAFAAPVLGARAWLWLALLLSSWWGRRWAAACCGPAIRGGWRARP